MSSCGQEVRETPTGNIDKDTINLRIRLMSEEYIQELIPAMINKDLDGIADGLGDLLYVVYGTAVSYGIPIDEIFAEIHDSNMSKFEDGKVLKNEFGKVMKGKHYFKPNLEKILYK